MTRTTIDFGIDLGTTNSAIAVLNGVTPEIIKNNDDADITPSAVSIDRKGTTTNVGLRAKNRVLENHQDTYLEFKRRMGSDFTYRFRSSGASRKPEELSAEVLKSLRADVQQRTGEVVEASVITVPAVFELHQCDATRKAAQLAGLRESPLLMEPTAASLAYGFQRESAKAYWLVYDFGGGTFDAALMNAEEGAINMVNHGGDNFLGGSDIDWAFVEKVLVPKFLAEYRLPDFDRGHAGDGQPWRQIFSKFKWVGEDVKIQLTRREKVMFEVKDLRQEGGGFTCDYFECETTRDELIRVAEPIILRSVEICKRVLKEKNLGKNAVERVILVGGPTLAPYFRELLTSSLGIPLDHSVDPLTVVARGAAVFAGTQRCGPRGPVGAGEYSIDIRNPSVGMDSAPIAGGKVSGPSTQDFTGFTLELVNTRTQWRSGKISLGVDGVFIANLHAERRERNTFAIELFDPSGRKRKTTPDTLTYTIGGGPEEQPLINSMGIALANNVYDKLFEKGRGLPLKVTRDYRTTHTIRQGQTGELIRIPIVEGENDLADRNRHIDDLLLEATNIRRDLPVGSEVEVTLRMDESRIITVTAFVPFLDDDFSKKVELRHKAANSEFLEKDYDAEMRRFREVKAKAADAEGGSAEELVRNVEDSPLMQEVKEAVAAAKGDPDAAAKCEKRLLELKLKLDEAADALQWPALVAETRQWLDYLDTTANRNGSQGQRDRTAELAGEADAIIAERKMDRLRKKLDQVQRLYWEIVFAQPGFWVNQFQQLEKQKERMSDQGRATRLLDQGRDCIAKNNATGLQNIVRQFWDLLPGDVVEAAQRGYQSGLVR